MHVVVVGAWLILKDGLLEHIRGCFKNSVWITALTKIEDISNLHGGMGLKFTQVV